MMAEAVGETQDVYRPNVSSYDAPNMAEERVPTKALALDTLSIFSGSCVPHFSTQLSSKLTHRNPQGKDEQFAFKRALSRLLEMTSASYARDEQWNPLPPDARKWETSDTSAQPPVSRQNAQSHSPIPSLRPFDPSDFAEEASLNTFLPSNSDRPPAPRLSPDHIWRVSAVSPRSALNTTFTPPSPTSIAPGPTSCVYGAPVCRSGVFARVYGPKMFVEVAYQVL